LEPQKKKKAPETQKSTSPPKGAFFADRTKNAPDVATATQKINDPEKLFEQAKKTHEKQLDWLNRGKGIDSVLGASVVRGDKEENVGEAMSKKGPVVIIGPLKKEEASKDKVQRNFDGDWSKLSDIVRASIAVDTFDDIGSVVKALEESGINLAEKPNDRFASPTDAGYRDLSLKVTYSDGHIGELQIHLKSIIKAKEVGHKYYEEVRDIETKAKGEGRGRKDLTDEEQKVVDAANAKMKDLYTKAWEEATKTKSASAHKVAAKTKYYKYEGFAAVLEHKKFPEVHWAKKPETFYDFEKFFREAVPISKSEFDKLKEQSKKASRRALSVKVANLWLRKA